MKNLNNFVTFCLIAINSILPSKISEAGIKMGGDSAKHKSHYYKVNIPVSNQEVVNLLCKAGKQKNPKAPWQYMGLQGISLDNLIRNGRNNNYTGNPLSEEDMKSQGWICIGDGIYRQETRRDHIYR
jgi:hypothetical protein